MKKMLFFMLVAIALSLTATADWPMYRCDAARSGYSSNKLSNNLSLNWIYESLAKPQPAWTVHDTRMTFDWAFQPIMSGDAIFFGSSTDCQIYCLDSNSGQVRWTFMTDSPIRFAPALFKERLFVTSDDGSLYCLSQLDGSLLWEKQLALNQQMMLGNDRMVSRWPVRGGIAIEEETLYVAAGIWPSEGILIHALNAETGDIIWKNDTSGSIDMDQPHSTARANSGVSAQGYLTLTDQQLLLPTGRAVPASFDKKTGEFQYFHLQTYGDKGGAEIVADGDIFFNGKDAFITATGKHLTRTNASCTAVTPQGVVLSGDQWIGLYQWKHVTKKDKRGNDVSVPQLQEAWKIEVPFAGRSLITVGDTIVSGGKNGVCTVDLNSKKMVWKQGVTGVPYGLAASNGQLVVSTDQGKLYGFSSTKTLTPNLVTPTLGIEPYKPDAVYTQAAKEIIEKSGITEGYCVDLHCGDGQLAYELAKRTKLKIYAVDSDIKNVRIARKKLIEAGVYGTQVTVHHQANPGANYAPYFANLIVSGRSVKSGKATLEESILKRLQRPYGGTVCLGAPGNLSINVRGALNGATNWDHQYADSANTICSDDKLVRGPLSMLWFRDTDFEMPQRHGRGPSPLVYDGLMFVEGTHGLRAMDAYNGRPIWEYPLENILKEYDQDHLMGVAGTGSNICMNSNSLFVRRDGYCLRLDPQSGKMIQRYTIPKNPDGTWGFIACTENTLYGSTAITEHIVKWRYLKGVMETQFTESSTLFALDIASGNLKWKYDAKESIRHNTIAIAGSRLFLIDRPIAEIDTIEFDKAKRRGEDKPVHQSGVMLALDAETGEELWSQENDIFGTMLAVDTDQDALLMCYQATRFKLDSETGGRMAVYQASTGKRLWEHRDGYGSRPLINGTTIYAQPSAWDLLTGEKRDFEFTRSYGCGILASAENMLVFRSATLGYRDLKTNDTTINYGGIRPGCWINAIPANGLLLLADAASGCKCSYLIQASIALINSEMIHTN